MRQNNDDVLQKWIIVCVSDKFVSLSHRDIRANILTHKVDPSNICYYSVGFYHATFFPVLTGKKLEQICSPEFVSRYLLEPVLERLIL